MIRKAKIPDLDQVIHLLYEDGLGRDRESISNKYKQKYKNENHLQKCIETGSDIFDRKVKKKKIDKNFFPQDLLKLMEENSTFYFGSKTTN